MMCVKSKIISEILKKLILANLYKLKGSKCEITPKQPKWSKLSNLSKVTVGLASSRNKSVNKVIAERNLGRNLSLNQLFFLPFLFALFLNKYLLALTMATIITIIVFTGLHQMRHKDKQGAIILKEKLIQFRRQRKRSMCATRDLKKIF